MILYSRVTAKPVLEPVELSEVKTFLKIDGTGEETLLNTLIMSARQICESYTGLSFMTQTRVVKISSFCGKDVILPYGPVVSVGDFTYLDEDGNSQTIDPSDYTLDSQSALAKVRVSESWPYTDRSLNNVQIPYIAGYGPIGTDVPQVIRQAILMVVASLYENRQDEVTGSMNGISWNSQALLDTVKVYWNAEV